jgi:hypothetical protein
VLEIEHGTSGSVARNSDHYNIEADRSNAEVKNSGVIPLVSMRLLDVVFKNGHNFTFISNAR